MSGVYPVSQYRLPRDWPELLCELLCLADGDVVCTEDLGRGDA